MHKQNFDGEVKQVIDAGTNVEVNFEKIPEASVLVLQQITVKNASSANSICDIGVKRGSSARWLKSITLTTADYFYTFENTVWIQNGDNIVLRFNDHSANDEIEAYSYGYYLY